jgi:hypothetical protein
VYQLAYRRVPLTGAFLETKLGSGAWQRRCVHVTGWIDGCYDQRILVPRASSIPAITQALFTRMLW